MIRVIMLTVVMLTVIMLTVVMLTVVMLTVVMLTVVMLTVVAPYLLLGNLILCRLKRRPNAPPPRNTSILYFSTKLNELEIASSGKFARNDLGRSACVAEQKHVPGNPK